MHANTVKSALTSHQIVGDMNKRTQEMSHIHSSIVMSALAAHQIARDMKKYTQVTACQQCDQHFQLRQVPKPGATRAFPLREGSSSEVESFS